MAALPALIASATIAYTIIFPNDNNKSKDEVLVASTRSTSYPSSPGCFLLGLSVGMTMSWLMSYEVKRRRLWETVRLKFLSWIYNGTSAANDNTISQLEQTSSRLVDKFRTPTLLSTLQGAPISQSDIEVGLSNRGESLNILSPDWTVSSGLHVNVLTLPSGTELVASTANGMEFYYVIKGNGTFHRNGEDFAVLVGYGWISDPSRYVVMV